MKCPCCKKENPEHPQICPFCGYDATARYEPATSRAGKAAVASFVLAILSFFTFLITAIPAIILACIALREIRRTPDRLKGKRLAIGGIIVSVFTSLVIPPAFYSLWRLDAPAIPNDYTVADLRSAPANCAESYRLLQSLCVEDPRAETSSVIGLSKEDVEMIAHLWETASDPGDPKAAKALRYNEKALELMWNKTKEARGVVAKLAEFAEIADLSDSRFQSCLGPMNITILAKLNRAYLYLQIDRGDSQLCVKELGELDSVVRKLAVNARFQIVKIACFVCLSSDITAANTIANTHNVSQESVELLATHFAPLADEATSMRNSVLSEYLLFKEIAVGSTEYAYAPRIASSFKRNSTLRLYRNYVDSYLATLDGKEVKATDAFSVWPSAYRGLYPVSFRPGEKLPIVYRCYNPGGSFLMKMTNLRFDEAFVRSKRLGIEDDLLQIVLPKRLGRPVSLKARAYGGEYIVDVKGKKIFSPGPDGKADTKDDIKLPINPGVLGWEE